ncbi:MAG TPA: DUF6600 domain-containing protein [Candidatus Angelobacter sp.]|nr:DUF6600 domain-containing protein [Candidatus Angelobacter sp.]
MRLRRQLGLTLAMLALLLVAGQGLLAQNQQDQNAGENLGVPTQGVPNQGAPNQAGDNPAGDPPARVARIQYISGEVSMQPGGVNDWVAANLNRPLTTSDRLWADKDSRVELNVGTGFIRLNSETSMTFTNVGDNTVQMQLDQGTLELTVSHLEPGEIFEIDTPNMAFTVMKTGVYRIDVPPNDSQTWVTVRKGQGEATGQGPAVKVSSGTQVRFTGQGSLQNASYAAPSPDGFDDWAQVRDKRLENSLSARYVAPGVIGYQDLDYYGTWRVVPNYGAIWVPTTVAAGWAPYRYGHWAYIAPWGWTWVDDAPWGFAPFHYGRWVYNGGYWGWAPGPAYVGWRPYYAPALVGWVGGAGWGFGVSFGVGFGIGGGCGWFALGWGEPYYPWYHGYHGGYVSQNYIRNVNVTNTRITNINNVTNNYYNNTTNNTRYANRSIAGAVTAAPKSALQNGQNIAKVGTVVPTSQLGKGEVMRSADVSPTKAAVLGGHTPNNTAVPPRNAMNRQVVTRATPPARAEAQQPMEARNTPPAPVSLGVHNPNHSATASTPRPAGTNAAATSGYQNSGAQHVVPKPPYAGGHAPAASQSAARTNSPGYSSGQTSAPTHEASHVNTAAPASQPTHAAPPASHNEKPSQPSKESKPAKDTAKGSPGMASSNAARPPAGYSYHAAPAYTASSYSNGGSYNGGARSYSANSSPYAGSRSGYSSATPSYRSGGGYTPPPTYSARASAPSMSRASAPSYSGGGHYSSGGGGGSSHAASSAGHGSSGHR